MKKYFILAAAVAMFAACTNDTAPGQDGPQNERIPLSIGYSMNALDAPHVTTRSNVPVQGTALVTTNPLGVFILKQGATTPTSPTKESYEHLNISSNTLTADNPANGFVKANFTSTSPSAEIFYPDLKAQELDIYAYAPYISSTTSSITASYVPSTWSDIASDVITFYTEPDQTADADFVKSDVLWGCAGTGTGGNATTYTALSSTGNANAISADAFITAKSKFELTTGDGLNNTAGPYGAYYVTDKNTADVRIPMLHRGSKIVVNLKTSGMEYAKLKKARVTLKVDNIQGELDLSTGAFTAKGAASVTNVVLTTRLGRNAADDADEGIYQESSTPKGYTCSAVIVPQTLTDATTAKDVIKIELRNSADTDYTGGTYTYTPASAPTFASGKVYTYLITVKASGLDVTTSVANWDTDTGFGTAGTETGDAVLQ